MLFCSLFCSLPIIVEVFDRVTQGITIGFYRSTRLIYSFQVFKTTINRMHCVDKEFHNKFLMLVEIKEK